MGRPQDPHQASLEQTLRRALRVAADSVEPGAEGLDRIRAMIAAGPATARPWSRWPFLFGAGIRLRQSFGAVIERFSPEPGRAGLAAWLRPAAALTTGAFVMAAASWALAALPSAIAPTAGSRSLAASPHHRPTRSATYRGHPGAPGPGGPPAPAASCTSQTGSIAVSPTASPTGWPSSSAGPSGSPSSSPTGAPSSSQSGTPSPNPTNSVLSSPNAKSASTMRWTALVPAASSPSAAPSGQTTSPAPQPSNSTSPGPSPSASPSASSNPCGGPVP